MMTAAFVHNKIMFPSVRAGHIRMEYRSSGVLLTTVLLKMNPTAQADTGSTGRTASLVL